MRRLALLTASALFLLTPLLALPAGWVCVSLGEDGAERIAGTRPEWADRMASPCSTFKILSALMAFECGIAADAEHRLEPDGALGRVGGMTLREAFRTSSVPYFRLLVGRLERAFVERCLRVAEYGTADLSAWTERGHGDFWLGGPLRISPRRQAAVMRRIFVCRSLFGDRARRLTESCMDQGEVCGGRLFAKTGSGRDPGTGRLFGWYVGFVQLRGGHRVTFAALGADPARDVLGAELREAVEASLPEARSPNL